MFISINFMVCTSLEIKVFKICQILEESLRREMPCFLLKNSQHFYLQSLNLAKKSLDATAR